MHRREREFEYGPVARGTFIALVVVAVPLPYYFPGWLYPYAGFLLFLAFGLRPLLERTGLYRNWIGAQQWLENKLGRKRRERLERELAQKARDEKYRRSRYRDPKLPRNW